MRQYANTARHLGRGLHRRHRPARVSNLIPPAVLDPDKIGIYPGSATAGGGYVRDAVLDYRVWCHPERGAGAPLALILQREVIDEPTPGQHVHVRHEQVTEWPVAFLRRPRRTDRTIPDFLSPDAPPGRLAILRGEA